MQTRTPLPSSHSPLPPLSIRTNGQPALIAQFPLKWMSSDEANVPSADYSLRTGRLEIRKPAQRGRFQKLEMRDRRGQFLEATMTV
jgi:hypothetical protein